MNAEAKEGVEVVVCASASVEDSTWVEEEVVADGLRDEVAEASGRSGVRSSVVA